MRARHHECSRAELAGDDIQMKELLLLGGGHSHAHVLAELARRPLRGVHVTLVTPFARLLYSGMLPGWMAGRYALDECSIALQPLAQAAQVTWVESAATALDAAARKVELANGQVLGYDALSINTGPVMDRDTMAGAREHALFVRPLEHFVPLWERLVELAQSRELRVVVIGAGAAGVELALAIERRLGERANVNLVTGAPGLLPGFSAGVQRRANACLRQRRISVLQTDAVAIAPAHVMLANGSRLACDAPIVAVGAGAPGWLRGSGLKLDAAGFIETGPTLQSLSHPEVFAAGDVAVRPDAPRPHSGVHAVRAGPPLARNLRRYLQGQGLRGHRPQARALYLLSCGDGTAIGAWGPLSWRGRWAGGWKDRIDRGFVNRYR
jgi:pyridine nucleotide-disulfide oxidoreductase family protein